MSWTVLYETTPGVWIGDDPEPSEANVIIDAGTHPTLGAHLFLKTGDATLKVEKLPPEVVRPLRDALSRILAQQEPNPLNDSIVAIQEVQRGWTE